MLHIEKFNLDQTKKVHSTLIVFTLISTGSVAAMFGKYRDSLKTTLLACKTQTINYLAAIRKLRITKCKLQIANRAQISFGMKTLLNKNIEAIFFN